jgi:PKD repeat protein
MKASRDLHPLLLPTLLAGVLVILACQSSGGSAPAPASAVAPTAAFPAPSGSPSVGQALTFTDASTGGPTAWTWSFGDGAASTLQNPTHTYLAAGTFIVTLKATNSAGSSTASRTLTVAAGSGGVAFTGNVMLGSPTGTSIKANVFSPDQGGTVTLAYGTASGSYTRQAHAAALVAATPLELALDGLSPDTQYYYRLYYQAGTGSATAGEECSFHTARPAGSAFTFCLQGDSHPERLKTEFDPTLYQRTLQTAAADHPDFYLTLGDDFSVDNLDPTTISAALVTGRYTLQRPFLGLVGKSAPVFLVNGNHEQAARYLLDGTPNNVAVWAQNARNRLYSQPAPDGFYTGNAEVVPNIGLLRNTFAWTWGDALFVVIDPYWGSPVCVDNPFGGGTKRSNLWDITHGDDQYQWLKATLEQSRVKYKFVFAHHVLGTQRGGVEVAGLYEWGGNNANGSWGFTANRPTWPSPIHQLLVAYKVTIFFQGHDHIWVRQQQDGVTYQTLAEPADPNYSLFNADAYLSGDKLPNSGYTRVSVAPTGVKVDYVRTWLPADEGPGKVSGSVAYSYTIP